MGVSIQTSQNTDLLGRTIEYQQAKWIYALQTYELDSNFGAFSSNSSGWVVLTKM